jgi:GTP:adenosylcobinamide-phosphate guanylyltransferase
MGPLGGEMEKFDVIMPAGGRIDDHFARVALTPFKALINVQDSMIGYKVIDAVLGSQRVGRTVLIASDEVKEKLGGRCTAVLKDTGDLTKNVKMGLQELKSMGNVTNRVLIVTTDLPYLESKLIDQFLDLCPDVDLAVPLISKEEYLDRFPSATGTFAKLQDGEWTVGCAYLFKPDVFMKALPQIEQVVENRKSVTKLAKILGLGFLWKVMTRAISVPEVVSKVESVIGCKIAAVKGGPAELAFDVDDIPDYEYALRNK